MARLQESAAESSGAPSPAAVRKAVLDEFKTRATFAGRLAEIDALLWAQSGSVGQTAEATMADHLAALGIRRVEVPEGSDTEAFVVTEGEGEAFELLRPAYVDTMTGKLILAGQLKRVPGSIAQNTSGGEA
ncbi:hypothetical protein AB0L85_15640 [Streptomyces sp. NPDC052051]|uniref:hypothetical protein n=1 Tax=Streptomyces sp. NPDC052051 TaxID=3154649 RepID=UPI0034277D50